MSIFDRIFGGQGDEDDAETATDVQGDSEPSSTPAPPVNGRAVSGEPPVPPEVSLDDLEELDDPVTDPDPLPPPLPPPPGETRTPREALLTPPQTVGGIRVAPKQGNRQSVTPAPVVSRPGGTPPRPTAQAPRRPPVSVKPRPSTPAPAAPTRQRASTVSGAFDAIVDESGGDANGAGQSSAADRAAVQQVFDELAASHVDQVRNVMLELQVGDVACSWMETSKATLTSLRSMAVEMENTDLVAALDGFVAAIDEAVKSGASTVTGAPKDQLVGRYQKLVELIPQAFALDGERDRREPIIVESLLRQVAGVEKLTIDRLFAAGLSKLDVLMRANAGDMAAAAGIPLTTAEGIAQRVQSYRSSLPTAVAAQDSEAEHEQLRSLLGDLEQHHAAFEEASAGWSDDHRKRKREARRQREQSFLAIRVVLARLGETDRLSEIEKQPFRHRISAIAAYLDANRAARRPPGGTSRPRTQPDPGPSPST